MKSRRLEMGPGSPDKIYVRFSWWLAMASLALTHGPPTWAREDTSRIASSRIGQIQSESAEQPFRLDDPIQRFTPQVERSAADLDRLQARSLFAHGRLLSQRQEYRQALRSFQRAYRLASARQAILDQIVILAIQLDQAPIAARYAALSDRTTSLDGALLRQLAIYLTERQQVDAAVAVYDLALSKDPNEKAPSQVLVRHEMGRLHFLQRRFKQSADCFTVVCEALEHPGDFGLDPRIQKMLVGDDGATLDIMAESFLKARRPERAAELFRKVNEQRPNEALLAFHMARIEEQRGHHDTAFEQLKTYLDSGQANAGTEPYDLLERLLGQKTDSHHGDLRDQLERLHQSQPDNVPLAFFLGNYYLKNKEWHSGRKLFAKLVKQAPSVEAYVAYLRILWNDREFGRIIDLLAEIDQRTGDLRTVEQILDEMAAEASGMNRLLEAAEERVSQATAGRQRSDLAFASSVVALKAGHNKKADAFFTQAIEVSDVQVKLARTLAWGLRLLSRERADQSIRVFQQGLEVNAPDTAKALFHFYLAGVHGVSQQIDKALHAAEQAARLNPGSTTFQSRKAWVLFTANRHADAESEYKRLISQFSNDFSEEARQTLKEAKSSLSIICVATKRMDEAEEWLEQLLDEYPADPGALNDLAYLWADRNKNMHRVLPMLEKAVEAEPENPAFLDSLGWALYRLERFDDSVVHLEKAVATEQPDGIILDHLGDAYFKQTRIDMARSSWQRAIQALDTQTESERIATIQQKIESLKSE